MRIEQEPHLLLWRDQEILGQGVVKVIGNMVDDAAQAPRFAPFAKRFEIDASPSGRKRAQFGNLLTILGQYNPLAVTRFLSQLVQALLASVIATCFMP